MPLLSKVREVAQPVKGPVVPKDVDEKIRRGREAMLKDANLRELCMKFWRNEQYWYIGAKGSLLNLPEVATATGGKPPHRIRNKYNFLRSLVEGKVSAATQRVPGYEVTPATNDQDDIAAAHLASQVAVYGYDKWRIRRATTKAVTNALVQREGFVMPYFDPNVGPFVETTGDNGESEWVGYGEIRLLVLSRSEVMWEPSVDFDDSRWHAIERQRLISDVEEMPGFVGGKLAGDVKDNDQMITVTEYLERPCSKYPQGRRLVIANGRVVVPVEPFPCMDAKGEVTDEPVLHRISYTVDPGGDDRGLVEELIDLQRTINDCWSKVLEWKNRCLNPQMIVPRGAQMARRDDTPGASWEYNPISGQKPEWERPPAVPRELLDILELAITHMRALASDVDVQAEPDVAAKTANFAIETSRQRWQSFLGDLAEFHSRLMRHCLMLVARHYTEERQIEIRGQFSWDPLPAFTGQDLRSQVNVRVTAGSIETKSRQTIMEEVRLIAELWPGALPLEAGLAAIQGGTGENLINDYKADVAAAWDLVTRIRTQGAAVLVPTRVDSKLMQDVPAFLPRPQSNTAVWKQVIGYYMKTPDFRKQPEETQHLFDLAWDALEHLEQARAMQVAMQQTETAAELGMANAARPQGQVPMPARPDGLSPEQADPAQG